MCLRRGGKLSEADDLRGGFLESRLDEDSVSDSLLELPPMFCVMLCKQKTIMLFIKPEQKQNKAKTNDKMFYSKSMILKCVDNC